MTLTDRQELVRLLALYQQEMIEHNIVQSQKSLTKQLLRRLRGDKTKDDEGGSDAQDIACILNTKRFKRWVANGGDDRAAVYRALVREIPQRPRIISHPSSGLERKEIHVCPQCSAHICEVQCYCELCGQAIDWRDAK